MNDAASNTELNLGNCFTSVIDLIFQIEIDDEEEYSTLELKMGL